MYHYADASWMRGSFGISAHWTSHSIRQDGTRRPYEEAVNGFDTESFAEELASAGAHHCILTLAHAEQILPCPSPALDAVLPGRTSRRDMLGELIASLRKRGIRFIAYYNHSCNGNDDSEWKTACGYADGPRHDLDRFADTVCRIVAGLSLRYGDGISGWWFDSGYSLNPNGPSNTVTCTMGDWQFPWEKLNQAAKTGNPECAVTFNAGVGRRYLYAECQDYYAGEATELSEQFAPAELPQMEDHRWICTDSPLWVFSGRMRDTGFVPPRFPDEDLRQFTEFHLNSGKMVTFNILIDQEGHWNPSAMAQVRRIRKGSSGPAL